VNLSVGRLARRFGLSRSTLLYYDRIGLLAPSKRSAAGYRLYGDGDVRRLEAICRYREIGLSLKQIGELLGAATGRTAELLEARLDRLNDEIEHLREQQRTIVRLLADPKKLRRARAMDKDRWVAILRAAGLDDAAMHRWHVEFERAAPAAHQDFLESLGLSKGDVARIRRWSCVKKDVRSRSQLSGRRISLSEKNGGRPVHGKQNG
jgi:DNA-binding transcriptional MerR regulator